MSIEVIAAFGLGLLTGMTLMFLLALSMGAEE